MNKNIHILPISATFREIRYPEPIIHTKEKLASSLKSKNLNVTIGARLNGGVDSNVYEGKVDGRKVVIKHTENVLPRHPLEFLIRKDGGSVDAKILKILNKSTAVRVPKLFYHYPKFETAIMEDMRESGYTLLNDLILKKKLPMSSAKSIGDSLAHLAKESRQWRGFTTNESAQLSYYDRSTEFLLAYPDNLERYYELEAIFTQYSEDKDKQEKLDRYFVWPDGHPKNMLVNEKGEVSFIDFGRSHWGDQRYMLPNFLAHILLYSLAGYIKRADAIKYLKTTVAAYREVEEYTDESIFNQYLAMEILHRANGRYIQGINKREQKLKLHEFGMQIFDENIKTIETMLKRFKGIK